MAKDLIYHGRACGAANCRGPEYKEHNHSAVPTPVFDPYYKWAGNLRAPLGFSVRRAPSELAHQRVDSRRLPLILTVGSKLGSQSPASQKVLFLMILDRRGLIFF